MGCFLFLIFFGMYICSLLMTGSFVGGFVVTILSIIVIFFMALVGYAIFGNDKK